MVVGIRAAVIGALVLSGCRSAHDVAVTSYRTATAPVNVVRVRPTESTNTAGATTNSSQPSAGASATQGGRSLPSASPESRPPRTTAQQAPANENTKPRAVPSQLDFPTAKPVEGKPGYVYSPFDPGKYVDVSGYAPGSKVKDPYSGKIFLVP